MALPVRDTLHQPRGLPGDEPAWMVAAPETARKMMQILDRRVAP